MSTMNPTVWTIGHSNHQFDKFAELLQKHAIQVLVDVRSRPQSRWVPWSNKKNLESEIPKLGIECQWAGNHLGGLPSDPAYYKPNPRKRKTDKPTIVDYDKIAAQPWFQQAVEELLETAGRKRTAIMCVEEDPQACHRSQLVGRALAKKGAKVIHIRGNGELETEIVNPPASAAAPSTHS